MASLTSLLARATNRLVIIIQDDADLVHQANLLLIVPFELPAIADRSHIAVGGGQDGAGQRSVDVREERHDVLCRNSLSLGYCRRGAHLGRWVEKRGHSNWRGVRGNERLSRAVLRTEYNNALNWWANTWGVARNRSSGEGWQNRSFPTDSEDMDTGINQVQG